MVLTAVIMTKSLREFTRFIGCSVSPPRLPSSTSTIAIYYYSARKLILISVVKIPRVKSKAKIKEMLERLKVILTCVNNNNNNNNNNIIIIIIIIIIIALCSKIIAFTALIKQSTNRH